MINTDIENLPKFSRQNGVLANKSFVYLSDLTDGKVGRPVFIETNLINKFKATVDQEKEELVLTQLEQLRALSGSIKAYTKVQDPKMHMTLCGDFVVTYVIFQHHANDTSPGVYILDFNPGQFSNKKAGLYTVTKRRGGDWSAEPNEPEYIDTRNAAINGSVGDFNEVAGDIMPGLVEYAYSKDEDNKKKFKQYTLFYNPKEKYFDAEGNGWITPESKNTNFNTTATMLAHELAKAQLLSEKVNWTILENGTDLFMEALKQLGNTKLDKHTLIFMQPTTSVIPALELAKKCHMKLHGEALLYSEVAYSSDKIRTTVFHGKRLGEAVKAFGSEENVKKGDAIKSETTKGRFRMAKTAVTLPVAGAVAIAAPHLLAASKYLPAWMSLSAKAKLWLSAAGGTGTALHEAKKARKGFTEGKKEWFERMLELPETIHTPRNVIASTLNLPDPVLNAKLVPHKNETDFNNDVMARYRRDPPVGQHNPATAEAGLMNRAGKNIMAYIDSWTFSKMVRRDGG